MIACTVDATDRLSDGWNNNVSVFTSYAFSSRLAVLRPLCGQVSDYDMVGSIVCVCVCVLV